MTNVIPLDPDTKEILDRARTVATGPVISTEVASVFARVRRELADPARQVVVPLLRKTTADNTSRILSVVPTGIIPLVVDASQKEAINFASNGLKLNLTRYIEHGEAYEQEKRDAKTNAKNLDPSYKEAADKKYSENWSKIAKTLKTIAAEDAASLLDPDTSSAARLEDFVHDFRQIIIDKVRSIDATKDPATAVVLGKMLKALFSFWKNSLIYNRLDALKDNQTDIQKIQKELDLLFIGKNMPENLEMTSEEYEKLSEPLRILLKQGFSIYAKNFWRTYEQKSQELNSKKTA